MVVLEGDGIHHPVDAGNGAALGHEGGMDALLDAVLAPLGNAEELDLEAQVGGDLDIVLGDAGNAFDAHLAGRDLVAEAERGENGELVGGVEAFDVEGRVGLA